MRSRSMKIEVLRDWNRGRAGGKERRGRESERRMRKEIKET